MTNQIPRTYLNAIDQDGEARSTDFLAGAATTTEVDLSQTCRHVGSAMWGAGNRGPNAGQELLSKWPGEEQPFLVCTNNTVQYWIATRDGAIQCSLPVLKPLQVLPSKTEQSLLYFLLFLNESKLKQEKQLGGMGTPLAD